MISVKISFVLGRRYSRISPKLIFGKLINTLKMIRVIFSGPDLTDKKNHWFQ